MRSALAAHDATLTAAIESHDGRLFKHTGDGVVAAFASAQGRHPRRRRRPAPARSPGPDGTRHRRGPGGGARLLRPTPEPGRAGDGRRARRADPRGLVHRRARRGHRAGSTSAHDDLRDLSEALQIYQVCADGLGSEFPPLKTVDTVPGNLPAPTTSFVGPRQLRSPSSSRSSPTSARDAHRRRRRGQDPSVDPGRGRAHPSVRRRGVARRAGSGREPRRAPGHRCDRSRRHSPGRDDGRREPRARVVRSPPPDRVRQLRARPRRRRQVSWRRSSPAPTTVSIIATSREALGVAGEHTWRVPPLDVDVDPGATSPAVSLFVERATAVTPDFALDGPGTVEAVTEICRRLDGIALAIELAAARMVVDERGGGARPAGRPVPTPDAGGRRGLERHQTLRHAVAVVLRPPHRRRAGRARVLFRSSPTGSTSTPSRRCTGPTTST